MLKMLLVSLFMWSAVVNESVGKVGDKVITLREVRVSQAVERVLNTESKKVDNATHEVTAVLLESIVALEAENFSVGQVEPDDVQKVISDLNRKSSVQSVIKEYSFQPEELFQLVKRKLVAQNFIQFKTNSFTTSISDEEAKSYYEANPKRFSGAGFEVLKPNIKAFLSQQQLNERLKSWFELLKRKYKVQNFLID